MNTKDKNLAIQLAEKLESYADGTLLLSYKQQPELFTDAARELRRLNDIQTTALQWCGDVLETTKPGLTPIHDISIADAERVKGILLGK